MALTKEQIKAYVEFRPNEVVEYLLTNKDFELAILQLVNDARKIDIQEQITRLDLTKSNLQSELASLD